MNFENIIKDIKRYLKTDADIQEALNDLCKAIGTVPAKVDTNLTQAYICGVSQGSLKTQSNPRIKYDLEYYAFNAKRMKSPYIILYGR